MGIDTGAAQAGTRELRLVLSIAILASFVAFLDGTVVNVALPAITEELGGGLAVQQWTVDAYLITLGALILVAGSLSDVYGRLVVMRVGLVGFGVTSVMIALAPTPEFLVISRGLQGIAGALLVPSSLALIMSNFRGPAQGRAIGRWTAFTSAAMIVGPLIGGLLVDGLSWRWVFLINILPITVTLVLMSRLTQRDRRDPDASVDYPGAVLAIIGLGGPVFALIEQGNLGWAHPAIWGPFIGGVIAFGLFLVRQRRARVPMMPFSIFRIRNFSVGNVATVLVYGALSLSGFIIVVFLQQQADFSAVLAGLSMLPVTIIMIATSSFFGGLSGRFGPRLFMAAGPIIAGVGFLLMLTTTLPVDYWTQLLPGILLFGLGLSTTVAPLTSAILGDIDPRQSGIGSAVNNAISRVAGLVAIALLGIIVGESLDLDGLHRGLIVTATLLIAGGLVSAVGIRNPPHATAQQTVASPAE
ncbi:EmrB/QacA subfamily drug resistance transporter [Homoserinimonas aerilata]|uniref:EmrB/QacA subfamily drug resistance transporter n=1 Tax=Homoserinimonas aerilata TaxID=1162970 RepID=A0A542YI87_9MICO|nr:MFS transporter [Homoserinimonas aerilata]TQL47806.1 EmrB/QacA subfamily drug resistance transporter [Homoserinimonas aerilata]